MIEEHHTYKFEYAGDLVEYIKTPIVRNNGLTTLNRQKLQVANKVTNISTGLVLKDRWGVAPRYSVPTNPPPSSMLDDELFQI